MAMQKGSAAIRIAREIRVAESALNAALTSQSQLFTSLVTTRDQLAQDLLIGQDALMRLVKAQLSLVQSGNDLARVHGKLLEINREVGGAAEDCPDDWRAWGESRTVIAA